MPPFAAEQSRQIEKWIIFFRDWIFHMLGCTIFIRDDVTAIKWQVQHLHLCSPKPGLKTAIFYAFLAASNS
jgi:hypothetical protein